MTGPAHLRTRVVVIGGGPAGSIAATVATAAGSDVVLLERGGWQGTHLPETWVGTSRDVLTRLGVTGVAEAEWASTEVRLRVAGRAGGTTVRLEREPGGPGVRLDRVRFDAALLGHARRRGADVRLAHTATAVEATPAGVRVHAVDGGGRRVQVDASVVVDASGKSALLGRAQELLRHGPELDPRTAVFTHVRPAAPSELGTARTMTVVAVEDGYLFVIPITTDRVSVGVVRRTATDRAPCDPAEVFRAGVEQVPAVAELVGSGTALLPLVPALNRPHRATTFAGETFALAGDAAAFGDPFLSAGCDVAVHTGAAAGRFASVTSRLTDPVRRRAAAEAYTVEVAGILDDHTEVSRAASVPLAPALVDPHLPPLLLPTAVLDGGGRPDPHGALRAARDGFALAAPVGIGR